MRKKGIIIFLICVGIASVVFALILPACLPFIAVFDVDFIDSGVFKGNYLVSDGAGNVVIVNDNNQVLWETPLADTFVHDADMLPNGNVIIADISNDRVIEVNISNPNEILWEWDARDESDIDWEVFGLANGWNDAGLDYVTNQNPPHVYWTHLNDVDFVNRTRYGYNSDSILISLRNFDLIIEVNYTETKEIIWHYGEPCNHMLLHKQHNPDRLDNNVTVICDSENHRIIEVDYDTKNVIWEYKLEFPEGQLRWARDCDDIGGGRYLITDSSNSRLIILDRESQQITRIYRNPFFFQIYEADYIDGNIIAGEYVSGVIIIDATTGRTQGLIGSPSYILLLFYCLFALISYHIVQFIRYVRVFRKEKQSLKQMIKEYEIYHRIGYLLVLSSAVIFIKPIIGAVWHYGIQEIVDFFIN